MVIRSDISSEASRFRTLPLLSVKAIKIKNKKFEYKMIKIN